MSRAQTRERNSREQNRPTSPATGLRVRLPSDTREALAGIAGATGATPAELLKSLVGTAVGVEASDEGITVEGFRHQYDSGSVVVSPTHASTLRELSQERGYDGPTEYLVAFVNAALTSVAHDLEQGQGRARSGGGGGLPFPDPLGALESATGGKVVDPVFGGGR